MNATYNICKENRTLFDLNKTFLLICCILVSIELVSGQTMQDIENIRKQYQEALKQQELQKPREIRDAEETAKSTSLPDKVIYTRKEVESLISNTQKLLDRLTSLEDSTKKFGYIGYQIFSERDTVPFWQNLPTPNDYVLGPGDEIIISLHGAIEQNISEFINRDGQVFLKDIGTINLSGMSVEKAYQYIKNKYSKVYSTLLGDSPTTFFDITIGELKSINVHIVGFAKYPGVHIIHPFSSVFSALSQSGGIDYNGSLRSIKIIREGETISNVDLYDYLFLGKSLSDTRLLDQDVIFIPPRQSTIAINGRVKNPGYYESKESEKVQQLLEYSGGFSKLAHDHVFLYNSTRNNQRSAIIKAENLKSNMIFDGDSIHVPFFSSPKKHIILDGKVKSAGSYPFQEGISLIDLLEIDGSINDPTFKSFMDLEKISIYRKQEDSKIVDRLIVNLTKTKKFHLKNLDQISVPPSQSYINPKSVIVTGEVIFPGLYNINNQKTLRDIVSFSGGLTKDALNDGIEVFRDSLLIAWENMNFILEDGDSLNVLRKTGTIQIVGEVNNPGFITFNKTYNAKDYINLAGGFNAYADDRDIVVVKPNGTAIPKKRIGWQKVPEGSLIVVNKKSLFGSSRGPSGWETFGLITSQAGNIATTILTLMLLMNQTNNAG